MLVDKIFVQKSQCDNLRAHLPWTRPNRPPSTCGNQGFRQMGIESVGIDKTDSTEGSVDLNAICQIEHQMFYTEENREVG